MPYNPGIQYRGDAYLAQGISGAGDALAKGLEKFADERKQAKAVETALGAVGSAVQHMVKQQVLPPDFLAKFQAAASGTTEQKRAALESVGAVLKFADQAQTMQARKQAMETSAAEEARAAALYKGSMAFPGALADELTQRWDGIAQAMTTPEPDAATVARAAKRANAPMLPQTVPGLERYSGGPTWYQQQSIQQSEQRLELARQREERLSQATGMSDGALINTINRLREAARAPFVVGKDKEQNAADQRFYEEIAKARGIPIPPSGTVTTPEAPAGTEAGKGEPPPVKGTTKGQQKRNLRTGITWTWDGSKWQ